MRPQELGRLGEQYAQALYRRRGYTIIDQNVFNRRGKRLGEIDFVAVSRKSLAFVEVKARRAVAKGAFDSARSGLEAVDWRKQQRLRRIVHLYLARHQKLLMLSPRIDVCLLVFGLDNRPKRAIIIPSAIEDYG